MNFTDDQKKIIDARDCNLLISAAAGSGKTAVMVERIIRLITDKAKPVDIDRFLVVTFTRAAAAQMREKIDKAINELLDDDPGNTHLQRQAALIHNAQITTIDAFCLYILKNNFSDADLEPGFRMADEGELKLLKEDVVNELIEEYYSAQDEEFEYFAENICLGAQDDTLSEIILKVYETSMSNPWPEAWIEEHSNDYYVNLDEPLSGPWFDHIVSDIYKNLCIAATSLRSAARIALNVAGPYMYEENLINEAEMCEAVVSYIEQNSELQLDELRARVERIEFDRLPACKDKLVDPELKERVNSLRKSAKADIDGILKKYLSASEETIKTQMLECNGVIKTLCRVAIEFKRRLDKTMKEKGILSFSNCEHAALDVLVTPKYSEGSLHNIIGWETTKTADEYRHHFDYVLIDEYQDSNMIQELLLSAVSGESNGIYNRFMVGDIKQSIYRFRQARPEIFIDKYDEYLPESTSLKRVDLHQNFRSRSQVLDFTNEIFVRLMSRKMGGVTYDDTASLHIGAEYPTVDDLEYMTELCIYEKGSEDETDKYEAEAIGVAERIKELVRSFKVKEENENKMRPLTYGDIVILFRAPTNYVDTYKKVFSRYEIPLHVNTTTGYFSTYEISTIMNLLKVVVNPLTDISLYGVMESLIGDFSVEELAMIKALYMEREVDENDISDGYLYDACKYVTSVTGYDMLREKVTSFLNMLSEFRKMSEYMTAEELLWEIFVRTDYRTKVSAMNNGERRLANVNMLLRKAADYTKTAYVGLHNFIRYINLLEKYEVDAAEAETTDENADVVRIMSIHKSKGLEFPVCIVGGLSKGFNLMDAKDSVVIDSDMGIGIKCVDLSKRTRTTTIRARAISEKIIADSLSEELRILYVAFTRAKEKLILTACADDIEKKLDNYSDFVVDSIVLPELVSKAGSFLDWILMCIATCGSNSGLSFDESGRLIGGIVDKLHMNCKTYLPEDITAEASARLIDIEILKHEYVTGKTVNITKKSKVSEMLDSLFEAKYQHDELTGLYTKTSVSELKKAAMPEEKEAAFELYEQGRFTEEDEYVPRFISGTLDRPGATVRGSAFHRVMELMDFDSLHNISKETPNILRKELVSFLDEAYSSGRLSEVQREIFNIKRNLELIELFIKSDTCERMAIAERDNKLWREAPFMMGLSARLLKDTYPEDETVLIQGIIDAYWEEDDGYVIIDYKTDRVQKPEELIDMYKAQLDYYEKALVQMNKPVKAKLIYSFALNEIVIL